MALSSPVFVNKSKKIQDVKFQHSLYRYDDLG